MEINSGFYLPKRFNPPSAFVYFRWSWSCYFGLGLKNLVLFNSVGLVGCRISSEKRIWYGTIGQKIIRSGRQLPVYGRSATTMGPILSTSGI